MFISKETDALLQRSAFSRVVTAASLFFVAVGIIGLGVGMAYKDRPLSTGVEEDEGALGLSAEQRALVEARIQGGVTPNISSEQQALIEKRIKQEVSAELSPEQQAIVESRLGAQAAVAQ